MKEHEFHAKLANTPLGERFSIINLNKYGPLTLNHVHKKISELQDIIRPYQIEIEQLLRMADEYYLYRNKKNVKRL